VRLEQRREGRPLLLGAGRAAAAQSCRQPPEVDA
jgi:hypothetical protein